MAGLLVLLFLKGGNNKTIHSVIYFLDNLLLFIIKTISKWECSGKIACFLIEVTENMSRIIRIRFYELWKLMEFLPKLRGTHLCVRVEVHMEARGQP